MEEMSSHSDESQNYVQELLSPEDVEDIWDNKIYDLSAELAPIDFRYVQRGRYSDVYTSSWDNKLVSDDGFFS
jgi:hypothetical protein